MTRLAAALAAILLAPVFATADDDPDFVPLFNGKDLTGWVKPDDDAIFSVEDGQIVGRTKENQLKKNEFLVSPRAYGDFVLKAKVKVVRGNSGIQFRSEREPNGRVTGPQADAADGYWGLLYEEGQQILERYPKEEAEKITNKDDWNEFVITAKGDHVTIDLNGTRVIDRIDPKFDKKGVIALQTHAGPPMEVRFKDLSIKVLD